MRAPLHRRCDSCLRTAANRVSISNSILLLSSVLQRRRGHKRSSCSWRRSEAFKAAGGGHFTTHVFVFDITILVQIAELENDVADLNARLRTANAGNFGMQHVSHASHNVRQSDRERAEAAAAGSQAREAKSLEKMALAKSDKKQWKVQLTHVLCRVHLILSCTHVLSSCQCAAPALFTRSLSGSLQNHRKAAVRAI